MGIDSQPQADRTEVDRLLHQLRSTLARLKAEVELLSMDGPLDRRVVDSVNDSLALLSSLELVIRAGSLVVVVDDDRRLADALSRQLRHYGFPSRSYASLSELPEDLPSHTKLVVDLSCFRLADPNLLTRIRGLKPIVLTGSTDPLAEIEARTYGAAACLLKPVDWDRLRHILVR